jgi:hypothetical protein
MQVRVFSTQKQVLVSKNYRNRFRTRLLNKEYFKYVQVCSNIF